MSLEQLKSSLSLQRSGCPNWSGRSTSNDTRSYLKPCIVLSKKRQFNLTLLNTSGKTCSPTIRRSSRPLKFTSYRTTTGALHCSLWSAVLTSKTRFSSNTRWWLTIRQTSSMRIWSRSFLKSSKWAWVQLFSFSNSMSWCQRIWSGRTQISHRQFWVLICTRHSLPS
jgi:hypothetical protein